MTEPTVTEAEVARLFAAFDRADSEYGKIVSAFKDADVAKARIDAEWNHLRVERDRTRSERDRTRAAWQSALAESDEVPRG